MWYIGLIETIQKEITALDDLKTRLISDVVTGKTDVRGVEIPKYEFVDEEPDTEDSSEEETEEKEEP